MKHSIFIQCQRDDLGTEYARFTVLDDLLKIEHYGKDDTGVFCVVDTEFLRFADYPEVRAVHDGTAWNPVELMMWLIALEPSPDTVALSKVNA